MVSAAAAASREPTKVPPVDRLAPALKLEAAELIFCKSQAGIAWRTGLCEGALEGRQCARDGR